MKAIVQDTYGSADVLQLEEIDQPDVGDDEVLVRVHAAGVDRGRLAPHDRPAVPDPHRRASGSARPKTRVPGIGCRRDASRRSART